MSLDKDNMLSVVVRFHDIKIINELEYCLFSLLGQVYRPIEVIVVCQNLLDKDIQVLEDSLRQYQGYSEFTIVVHNMECSIPGDYRSKLLNEGIQTAAGRFLAFLDYDDIIYPHAYELLIDTLINEQVAIAFGRIIISHVKPQKNNFYYTVRKEHIFNGETKYQLMQGNFCPIHSFVLDRKLIPREDLFFSEESVKFEDYHFLLRIVARYPSAFSDINEIVGEYIMRLDGSNTVSIHSATDRKKVQEWEAATRWIEEEKKKIFMNISVHDFNRLLEEMQKKGNFDSPVLQEILQSRSWKITAPLRWITQKIKAWRNNG